LSDSQRWATNKNFLNKIAAKGDKITLNIRKKDIVDTGFLKKEVEYLTTKKGYVWVNQWSLKLRK